MNVAFTAPLWRWQGQAPGAWHFVTLPVEQAGLIRMAAGRRGFGTLRVTATIRETVWKTSLFPDRKSGSYLLPVKAEVREREALSVGDNVSLRLSLDL